MILNLLINLVLLIFGSLFVFFPVVHLSDIPLVGSGLVSVLSDAVHTWNAFLVTFPYAALPWHVFLYVLMPFEITLRIFKFFFGSRSPVGNIN